MTRPRNAEEMHEIGKVHHNYAKEITLGDRIYSKPREFTTPKYDREKRTYKVFTGSGSVKQFTGGGRNICDVIDSFDKRGRMLELMRYLRKNTNQIMYMDRHTKHGYPATRSLLYRMAGYKDTKSAREFIGEMVALDIIKIVIVDKAELFFINPLYAMVDNNLSLDTYCLFKESLDKELWPSDIEEIGKALWCEAHPEECIEMETVAAQQEELMKAATAKTAAAEANEFMKELFGADFQERQLAERKEREQRRLAEETMLIEPAEQAETVKQEIVLGLSAE